MKIFVCLLLFVIILIACKKQGSEQKLTTQDIDVMVYATHANDTTQIVSTDTVHIRLP
jgi:hypothetical protein